MAGAVLSMFFASYLSAVTKKKKINMPKRKGLQAEGFCSCSGINVDFQQKYNNDNEFSSDFVYLAGAKER